MTSLLPAPADAAVLGQLLLMQNVLCGLPDERSIFGFIGRGLSLLPGVAGAAHEREVPPTTSDARQYALRGQTTEFGEIVIRLSDPARYAPYESYVTNFLSMVGLVLEERAQRAAIQRHQQELEQHVRSRTAQLLAEIGERRAVEAQLQQSRDMLALTLNSAPQAIYWKDAAGKYLGGNQTFAQLCGLDSPEQIAGKTDRDLPWREEDIAGYLSTDRQVLETGQAKRDLLEQVRGADGIVRWVETTKVPLRDCSGQPYAVLGVFEDVTERRVAEQERQSLQMQLAQAQKMESIGRLAGGVAHDFNNMLQAILGNASLALSYPGVSPQLREHLEEIRKAAERSAALTQQLLTFARKQSTTPRVLDLNAAVERTLKMLQRLITEEIHLQWEPGPALWPVKIDPNQVDQLLANLVVNARDAITGAGIIKIGTANLALQSDDPLRPRDIPAGDYVTLTVEDTGAGLSPAAQAHLFEPFFTTKPAGQGTGLGLATVYGIVRQNRGTIGVSTAPDLGTAFTVYLPRELAPAAMPERPPELRPARGTETVLLVEDEQQILTLTQMILQFEGYEVLAAAHPDDALAIAQRQTKVIHLLITDVIMPGMNGSDLYRRISEMKPDIRCLFISGFTADLLPKVPLPPDRCRFLAKPFTAEDLSRNVRAILDAGLA